MPLYRRIVSFVPFPVHWAVGIIDTAQQEVILLDSSGSAFNLAQFHEVSGDKYRTKCSLLCCILILSSTTLQRIRSFLLAVYTREIDVQPLLTVPDYPMYEELPLSVSPSLPFRLQRRLLIPLNHLSMM